MAANYPPHKGGRPIFNWFRRKKESKDYTESELATVKFLESLQRGEASLPDQPDADYQAVDELRSDSLRLNFDERIRRKTALISKLQQENKGQVLVYLLENEQSPDVRKKALEALGSFDEAYSINAIVTTAIGNLLLLDHARHTLAKMKSEAALTAARMLSTCSVCGTETRLVFPVENRLVCKVCNPLTIQLARILAEAGYPNYSTEYFGRGMVSTPSYSKERECRNCRRKAPGYHWNDNSRPTRMYFFCTACNYVREVVD